MATTTMHDTLPPLLPPRWRLCARRVTARGPIDENDTAYLRLVAAALTECETGAVVELAVALRKLAPASLQLAQHHTLRSARLLQRYRRLVAMSAADSVVA